MDRRAMLRAGLALSAVGLPGCGGLLTDRPETSGDQDRAQVVNRLQELETRGYRTHADIDATVGGVVMVVAKNPDADNIDLSGLTLLWLDSTGEYDLIHETEYQGNVDGTFTYEPIRDADGSLGETPPLINSDADRVGIVIDLGGAESRGRIAAAYDTGPADRVTIRAGEGGLPEGDTADVRITTATGTVTTVHLTVPESCCPKTVLRL